MSPEISVPHNNTRHHHQGSSKLTLLQTLHEGDSFGERSLYVDKEIYLLSYQSRSFCEILFLSSSSFKRQCQLHLTTKEREALEDYLRQLGKTNQRSPLIGEGEGDEEDEQQPPESVEPELNPTAEIGTRAKVPPPPSGFDSESDSDSTLGTGGAGAGGGRPVAVSSKNRRVALQLDVTLKLEGSNFRTVWFHPENRIMTTWKIIVAVSVLYYMFAAPLLLSICLDDNVVEQNTTIFFFSYLADTVMVINLIMSMFFFPFVHDGILFSESDEIYAEYRSKHSLVLDVLTLFPIDLLAILFGANLIPVLRLPRLLFVFQTRRYLLQLKGFSEKFQQGQLIVLIWWLYMLVHWFGCIFVLAAKASTRVTNQFLSSACLSTSHSPGLPLQDELDL
jgi:hypothetical protein